MDLDAIGVLHGVEYDGRGLLIIDGQHRVNALIAHGLGEWEVEVKVHLDIKDDKAACDKFWKLNKRAVVSPFGGFMVEFHAGYRDAVGAHSVVKRHGLIISRSAGDGKVICVSALKKLFKADGGKALDATFGVILSAWGSKSAALEGKIVEGIGLVFQKYLGAIDESELVKKLAKYAGGPSGLIGSARGMKQHQKSTVSRCIADLVIGAYNSGKRSGKLDPL